MSKIDPWAREIEWATTICSPLGCAVIQADLAKYEIAKVTGDGVSLVIYPHTTTGTRNQHARVRDNGSKDKHRAQLIMEAMDQGFGLSPDDEEHVRFSCTFTRKNHSSLLYDTAKLRAELTLLAASNTGGHHG